MSTRALKSIIDAHFFLGTQCFEQVFVKDFIIHINFDLLGLFVIFQHQNIFETHYNEKEIDFTG